MQFVCRDCGYKGVVQDRSLQQCPECGSSNTKIFVFGSQVRRGGEVERSKKENVRTLVLFIGFLSGVILIIVAISVIAAMSVLLSMTLILVGAIIIGITVAIAFGVFLKRFI